MAARPILEPRPGRAWRDEVRALVHRLEDRAPKGYDGVLVAPYRGQQRYAMPSASRGYTLKQLDVIALRFRFRGGNAGEPNRVVLVRLTRVAAVNLLRAMRDVPQIEVGFGSGYYSSLRTYTMQSALYANYLAGGPRAAKPGLLSWHLRCAVDLGYRGPGAFPNEEGRQAMLRWGFHDLGAIDPPHHTFGRRG
jgi:hypothetical protein